MEIKFGSRKFEKQLADEKSIRKFYGKETGKKILQRIHEFRFANNLEEIRLLPGAGFHSLKGEFSNRYAVRLKEPYRLIFEIEGDKTDFKKVTTVVFLEILDYH